MIMQHYLLLLSLTCTLRIATGFLQPLRTRTLHSTNSWKRDTTAGAAFPLFASPKETESFVNDLRASLQGQNDFKVDLVRKCGASVVGKTIEKVQVLEYYMEEFVRSHVVASEVDPSDFWLEADGPVVIHCGTSLLSIQWQNFDTLLLCNDIDDPEKDERYAPSREFDFNPVIGRTIRGLWLGACTKLWTSGEHTVSGWPTLYMDLGDDLWLEVYNALDENGYKLHKGKPDNYGDPLKFCI